MRCQSAAVACATHCGNRCLRNVDSSRITASRSGSSLAPSTSGCAARICSTSVDPERGRLTTKITDSPSAGSFARGNVSERECGFDRIDVAREGSRIPRRRTTAHRVRGRQRRERVGVSAGIFERFAECEAGDCAIGVRQVRIVVQTLERGCSSASSRTVFRLAMPSQACTERGSFASATRYSAAASAVRPSVASEFACAMRAETCRGAQLDRARECFLAFGDMRLRIEQFAEIEPCAACSGATSARAAQCHQRIADTTAVGEARCRDCRARARRPGHAASMRRSSAIASAKWPREIFDDAAHAQDFRMIRRDRFGLAQARAARRRDRAGRCRAPPAAGSGSPAAAGLRRGSPGVVRWRGGGAGCAGATVLRRARGFGVAFAVRHQDRARGLQAAAATRRRSAARGRIAVRLPWPEGCSGRV